jgi:hypothetical protein
MKRLVTSAPAAVGVVERPANPLGLRRQAKHCPPKFSVKEVGGAVRVGMGSAVIQLTGVFLASPTLPCGYRFDVPGGISSTMTRKFSGLVLAFM